MGIQSAVEAILAYKLETTFGTDAGAAGSQLLRRVSTSLAGKKGAFASNEVRSDMQVSDMRHGGRSVAGSIEAELALASAAVTYEDLIQAVMRGTWSAGVSAAPADFATGVTIANGAGANDSVLTFAGAGSLLTKGFKVGDIVRGTGLTTPANNAVNARIVALTATTMTVVPRLAATAQQAAGWSIGVQGKKLLMGTTKRSFTFEQRMLEALTYQRFRGCRVNGMAINLPPNGMGTISFDVMGQDFVYSNTAYYTAPTVESSGGNLSGIDGALRLAGVERGIVTGLQLNLTNNCSMPPVIGSNKSPEVFYGRMVVTGSVSALLEDVSLLQAFDQESEVDIVAVMEASGPDPQDFLAINIQRAKFSDAQPTIGPDGAVVVQLPFQALLASGTGKDTSTMVIQRSNGSV